MKRMTKYVATAVIAALAAPGMAMQQDESAANATDEAPELTISDDAPQLEVAHWLKGEPIDSFEPDKTYVVEFWATWCGPCRAAMPHVSELQEKYRDYGVSIVGISDEDLPTVVEFLTQEREEGELWYETIQYTLATDPERRPYTAYMKAAAQRGIPTAFIVGKTGKVEWIGHPMNIDEPLDEVVRDEWDRDAFREEFIVQQERERQVMELTTAMRQFRADEDWHGVLTTLDKLIEINDTPFYKVDRFLVMLRDLNTPKEAYRYGNEIAEANWDDAYTLNHMAWSVVDEDGIETRDLDFALRLARRANELTESKDAAILDTLARVHYEKGDLAEAVKWQRLSVEQAEGMAFADDLKEALERYEAELDGEN